MENMKFKTEEWRFIVFSAEKQFSLESWMAWRTTDTTFVGKKGFFLSAICEKSL